MADKNPLTKWPPPKARYLIELNRIDGCFVIASFHLLQYTFNGKGEFVLARANTKDNRLDIQARFEQLPINAYGEVRATQMTSLAARGNLSTVVEVRVRPTEAQWRYRLDVFVDKKRVYFDRPALKFQHFRGV